MAPSERPPPDDARPLMKDGLNAAKVRAMADAFQAAHRQFPADAFIATATARLGELELKDRVTSIADALRTHLPPDYLQALDVLLRVADGHQHDDPNDPLRGFAVWPLFTFVELHGLDHFDESMQALRRMTHLFSAEFAVRPYLLADTERALGHIHDWVNDPDEHVRRLASEGTRPRLPWGQRLGMFVTDPSPCFPLLEALKDDPAEYVRRSVANHLNDIAKDHPELVLDIAERWLPGASRDRERLIKHALRSIIKAGHPRVFPLLGYTESPKLHIALTATPELTLGDTMTLDIRIESLADTEQRVVLDYAMHFKKADGKTKPKVFKLKNLRLAPREAIELQKRQTIKAISTRRYYAGEQAVALLVNGVEAARQSFTLDL